MAKGLSLHIGLNSVDAKHYRGWSGDLAACENDAHSLADVCRAEKITPAKLITQAATRAAVLKGIAKSAAALKAGDLFVLSYSGHGGQVPDVNGDEPDRLDETWCLWDGELIDDELYAALGAFKEGCRVLVLSDSCHSGSVTRDMGARPRQMPKSIAQSTYYAHQAFYDGLQLKLRSTGQTVVEPSSPLEAAGQRAAAVRAQVKASVVLISGCQDNQLSLDGPFNGAFTERLLAVWQFGSFVGSHVAFHKLIVLGMPDTQSPNLFTLGPVKGFLSQRPFTVDVAPR